MVFVLGFAYFHCAEGLSPRNLRLLEEMARVLQGLTGPWCVGGDWQMEPEVLLRSGFARLVKGVIFAPSTPTCRGHVIDYFVVSENVRSAVQGARRLDDTPFEPHSPVRIFIKAAPREDRVRKMVRLARVEPILPAGCLRDPGVLAT